LARGLAGNLQRDGGLALAGNPDIAFAVAEARAGSLDRHVERFAIGIEQGDRFAAGIVIDGDLVAARQRRVQM
jgi:putative intracellular protease/amidase